MFWSRTLTRKIACAAADAHPVPRRPAARADRPDAVPPAPRPASAVPRRPAARADRPDAGAVPPRRPPRHRPPVTPTARHAALAPATFSAPAVMYRM